MSCFCYYISYWFLIVTIKSSNLTQKLDTQDTKLFIAYENFREINVKQKVKGA